MYKTIFFISTIICCCNKNLKYDIKDFNEFKKWLINNKIPSEQIKNMESMIDYGGYNWKDLIRELKLNDDLEKPIIESLNLGAIKQIVIVNKLRKEIKNINYNINKPIIDIKSHLDELKLFNQNGAYNKNFFPSLIKIIKNYNKSLVFILDEIENFYKKIPFKEYFLEFWTNCFKSKLEDYFYQYQDIENINKFLDRFFLIIETELKKKIKERINDLQPKFNKFVIDYCKNLDNDELSFFKKYGLNLRKNQLEYLQKHIKVNNIIRVQNEILQILAIKYILYELHLDECYESYSTLNDYLIKISNNYISEKQILDKLGKRYWVLDKKGIFDLSQMLNFINYNFEDKFAITSKLEYDLYELSCTNGLILDYEKIISEVVNFIYIQNKFLAFDQTLLIKKTILENLNYYVVKKGSVVNNYQNCLSILFNPNKYWQSKLVSISLINKLFKSNSVFSKLKYMKLKTQFSYTEYLKHNKNVILAFEREPSLISMKIIDFVDIYWKVKSLHYKSISSLIQLITMFIITDSNQIESNNQNLDLIFFSENYINSMLDKYQLQ